MCVASSTVWRPPPPMGLPCAPLGLVRRTAIVCLLAHHTHVPRSSANQSQSKPVRASQNQLERVAQLPSRT
eukprot:1554256-Pyramimonas_sp.AAC.1